MQMAVDNSGHYILPGAVDDGCPAGAFTSGPTWADLRGRRVLDPWDGAVDGQYRRVLDQRQAGA